MRLPDPGAPTYWYERTKLAEAQRDSYFKLLREAQKIVRADTMARTCADSWLQRVADTLRKVP